MIKIKFAYYLRNGGDGSASLMIFPDEEDAESFASSDDERLCDDIGTCTFLFDEKRGEIVQPPLTKSVSGQLFDNYKLTHNGKTYKYTDKTDWSTDTRPNMAVELS